jgi:hypothetical protein
MRLSLSLSPWALRLAYRSLRFLLRLCCRGTERLLLYWDVYSSGQTVYAVPADRVLVTDCAIVKHAP